MKLKNVEQDNSSTTGKAGIALINEMSEISGLNHILIDHPTSKMPVVGKGGG